MTKNFGGTRRAPIIVAARPGVPIRIARYQDTAGETILGNADFTPHAITDGAQLQAMGSERQELSASETQRLLHVGTCHACNTRMMANASAVDSIDVAGTDIHCVMCSASVRPDINYTALSRELAMEVAADDDEDEGEDSPDDASGTYDDMSGDDDDGSSGDAEANNDDDDDSLYDDGDDGDTADAPGDEDDGDVDDTTDNSSDDGDGDDEVEEAAAMLRPLVARVTRPRAFREHAGTESMTMDGKDFNMGEDNADMLMMDEVPMNPSDMLSDDGDPEGDGTGMGNDRDRPAVNGKDFDEAVAAVSREIRRMGRNHPLVALAADDDEDEKDDDEEKDDADDSERDDEVAAAQKRVRTARRRLRAVAGTESMDMNGMDANRGEDDADMARMDEVPMDPSDMVGEPGDPEGDGVGMGNDRRTAMARAELTEAMLDLETALDHHVQPVAGRARDHAGVRGMHEGMRGRLRQARGQRIDGNGPMKSTVAKAGMDDDLLLDPMGMDGADGMNGLDDVQPETPGTRRAAMDPMDELSSLHAVDWPRARVAIANVDGARWVFADGRPVARLDRQRATASVQAQWDSPTLEKAFLNAVSRGLPEREAREFGVRGMNLRVSGSEQVRNSLRNARTIANARAQTEIAAHEERARQCLTTAFLGVMKGMWQDARCPLRDVLVQRMSTAGVMEPRALVDAAVAAATDSTLQVVFAKARELAAKPAAARNEVASMVATAAYARSDASDGSDLARRLDRGNGLATAAAAGTSVEPETAAHAELDLVGRMRSHVATLGR